jgi:hypothetical protein
MDEPTTHITKIIIKFDKFQPRYYFDVVSGIDFNGDADRIGFNIQLDAHYNYIVSDGAIIHDDYFISNIMWLPIILKIPDVDEDKVQFYYYSRDESRQYTMFKYNGPNAEKVASDFELFKENLINPYKLKGGRRKLSGGIPVNRKTKRRRTHRRRRRTRHRK